MPVEEKVEFQPKIVDKPLNQNLSKIGLIKIALEPEKEKIESNGVNSMNVTLVADNFSLEKVQLIWEEYLSELKTRDNRVYSGVRETKIEINPMNSNEISLIYVSQSSLSEFEPHKPPFLKKLRTLLNNDLIELQTKVEALRNTTFVMRKEEIFQQMVQKNPLLNKLRENLDLDIY